MTTEYTDNLALNKPDFRSAPWHSLVNDNMDKLDRAFTNISVAPTAWANSTAYTVGQTKIDTLDVTFWVCLVGHTSAASPTTFAADRVAQPTYWRPIALGLSPRDQWLNATAYRYWDIVYDTVASIVAICLVPHTSRASGAFTLDIAAHPTYWAIVADFNLATVTATGVSFTPAGSIAAITVQAAIQELDSEVDTRLDTLDGQVLALDAVNVTQGNDIDASELDIDEIEASLRNYIDNGDLRISQVNGTTPGTTSSFYPVDRFFAAFSNDGSVSIAQVASATPAGGSSRIRVTVTGADAAIAAGQYSYIATRLEGNEVSDLEFGLSTAKTFTVAFGVKAPAGTYGVAIRNSASNRTQVKEFTIAGGEANTSVRKFVTFTGDLTGTWVKDTGIGIELAFCLAAGATYQTTAGAWQAGSFFGTSSQFNFMGTNANVFELFDIGMYLGSVDPGHKVESYAAARQKCLRYWEAGGLNYFTGNVSDTNSYYHSSIFSVQKRVTPTCAVVNGANSGFSASHSVSSATTTGLVVGSIATSTGVGLFAYNYTADARL